MNDRPMIEALARQIDEAICRVCREVDKVELWAGAVDGCAQTIPVPAYWFDLSANQAGRPKSGDLRQSVTALG